MKKILLGIIACLGIGLATTGTVKTYAEENNSSESISSSEIISSEPETSETVAPEASETPEEEPVPEVPETSETPEEEEEPEVVYPCSVVVEKTIGGEILVDITEGNVGDVVTVHVGTYVLYSLKSVKVNGVELSANAEGNYTFTLAEGENKLVVEFAVDDEQMATFAELFAQAKDGEWSEIFSVENILTFISWGITTLLSSGFLLTLIKNKKIRSKTAEEISVSVENKVEKASAKAITTFLTETLEPVTNKMSTGLNDMEEAMKILVRCFVLSQENTPESRLAIIKELTNLKTTSQELSEQVKAMIDEEILKRAQVEQEKAKSIADLKEANNAIEVKETNENIKGSY